MLALKVEFLLGRYAATDFRDRDRPEWPPHPARLFSALVAAACESGLGESARAALLWLEKQPPPCITADQAPGRQTPVTVYVPVNDPGGDLLPQRAERQPRAFPSVVPAVDAPGGRPRVHFIWAEANPDPPLRGLLASVAAQVSYLGSSRSPVCVRLADNPPEPTWFPDDAGKDVLRVPSPGRLESLAWHYANGLRPPAGAFQRYRRGQAAAVSAAHQTVYGEMVVYRLTGPAETEIETTLRLTDVLRAAAMSRAQEALGEVPAVLSGHDGKGKPLGVPHAAYVGLPFVSDTQPHADGRVLGLAVVLPRALPVQERRRLGRALARVDHLMVPGVGRLGLRRVAPGEEAPQRNLREETWADPSQRWSSVTPVVLDRFPKKGGPGLTDILAKGCEHVGLPRPAEVAAGGFSPLHGVEPSSRFRVRRGQGPPRLYTHVTLTFDEPVRGPLLLGAARHFGLGLLRPLQRGAGDGAR
jgi:CRISPR-associated protein Csb2